MKTFIKLFRFVLIVPLITSVMLSCEEQDNSFKGEPVVEFQQSSRGTVSVTYAAGSGVVIDTAVVQLVGPHQTSNKNLTFVVDNTSTAVEGTHYNLLTDGTFVLPSGSSFGYIRFEVLTDNATTGEEFTLDLTLTGGDFKVSENYKQLTHEIKF